MTEDEKTLLNVLEDQTLWPEVLILLTPYLPIRDC